MKQVILVIYFDNNEYVSLLHKPKTTLEMNLWVQAELCKEEYKGKEWELFSSVASSDNV